MFSACGSFVVDILNKRKGEQVIEITIRRSRFSERAEATTRHEKSQEFFFVTLRAFSWPFPVICVHRRNLRTKTFLSVSFVDSVVK
jgi:hypothetical protein